MFNLFPAFVVPGLLGLIGVTAGVHRLWAHKSYTASRPLKFILLWWYTMAAQVLQI